MNGQNEALMLAHIGVKMKNILLVTTSIIGMTAQASAWDAGICSNGWCTYTMRNQTKYQDPIHNDIEWWTLTDTSVNPPVVSKFQVLLHSGEETHFVLREKGACKRDLAIYLHRWPGAMGSGPLSAVFDTIAVADAAHAPYQFDVCHKHEIIVSKDKTISYD